jgi:ArsR family transcriptional regulator
MTLIWKTKPESQEQSERQLAGYFKALGHPVRVRILRTLQNRGGCTCGDLVELFPLAQSTVSQHLRILRDARIIEGVEEGPRRTYQVNARALGRMKRYVQAI